MQTETITRRHIIRYACGCTTTRIEVLPATPGDLPVCAGHLYGAIREEQITEYQEKPSANLPLVSKVQT